MDELEVPQHVQQLQQLSSLLQNDKADSDSVTWVPELIPKFVQKAVEAVCSPTGDKTEEDNKAAHDSAHRPKNSSSTALQLTSDITSTHSAPTAPATALAIGTQHAQFTNSSKRPVQWVFTTCLVPDGLPTAAAAEDAGGLATLEVVCRLLMLQDCQPATATPALEKALKKVKWQQYGLQYREYFSYDDNTGTGIITLGVLPDAVMVPLSLIVCCCNSIEASPGGGDPDEPSTGMQEQADSTQQQDAPPKGSKRKRGGVSRSAPKAPTLSMRRELPLWVGAFEAALSDLKGQLPGGYMRGKHEALLAAALPPIALSLGNIMARAANAHFKQESCRLLGCEPGELQETLLTQLEELAADALAYKTSAANQQQRKQAPQSVDTAAAAAALLAAEYPDHGEDMGVGQQELQGEQPTLQTQHGEDYQQQQYWQDQPGYQHQEDEQQQQQQWQDQEQQQHWQDLQQQQQQQQEGWHVHGSTLPADAAASAWGADPTFSDSRQYEALGPASRWVEHQQQAPAAGTGLWDREQGYQGTGVTEQQPGAWDGRTAWNQQSQQVQPVSQQQQQQQQQQEMQLQQQQQSAWGMLSRQHSAGPQQVWQAVDATAAAGVGLTPVVSGALYQADGLSAQREDARLQVTGGSLPGPPPRPATAAAPAFPRPNGRRRMSGSVAASLF